MFNGIHKTVGSIERVLSKSKLLSELYIFPYRGVVSREISLSPILPKENILVLGCGPIPFTAILIARFTGARVLAVDNQQEATIAAGKLIRKLKLDHLVRIELADALTIKEQLHGVKVVFLALQLRPKNQIIHNLFLHADSNTRFIARIPRNKYVSFYETYPSSIPRYGRTFHNMKSFGESNLFLSPKCSSPLTNPGVSLFHVPVKTPVVLLDVPQDESIHTLGLRSGKTIQVLGRQLFGGPFIILTDQRVLMLDKEIVKQIHVKDYGK
jgi:hypothetical protein